MIKQFRGNEVHKYENAQHTFRVWYVSYPYDIIQENLCIKNNKRCTTNTNKGITFLETFTVYFITVSTSYKIFEKHRFLIPYIFIILSHISKLVTLLL